MQFQERAVFPGKAAEGIERFHYPCASGPSTSRTPGKCNYGDRARRDCLLSHLSILRIDFFPCIEDLLDGYILDLR
jgi:hypothetical protein